tara:strand:+ start:21 stop:599 length:579 start_codon:yes stop_codon:yes gene_type:complete
MVKKSVSRKTKTSVKSVPKQAVSSSVKKSTRSFKVRLPGSTVFEGRFTGLTPYQAANKALTKLYKLNKNKNLSKQVTFTIRESTRGSKKKEYTYNGNRSKLSTPVSYNITDSNGVTKTITKQFKNTLTKVKLADLKSLANSTPVVSSVTKKSVTGKSKVKKSAAKKVVKSTKSKKVKKVKKVRKSKSKSTTV